MIARVDEIFRREIELVILYPGVNDMLADRLDFVFEQSQIGNYIDNVEILIKILKDKNIDVLIVNSFPVNELNTNPLGWVDFYIKNKDIERFQVEIRKVCKSKDYELLDIFEEFSKSEDLSFLDADGLHPNSKGHEIIFERIVKYLEENYVLE